MYSVSLEMQHLDIQFLNLVVSNPFEMWPFITKSLRIKCDKRD